MRSETVRRSVAVLAVVTIGVVVFMAGRLSAPGPTPSGPRQPASSSADYLAGLRAGEAQGRQEGRALQEGASLPKTDAARVRAAFDTGYAAGANDVFTGYDGGWAVSTPYLVTLTAGSGGITYRIARRTLLSPGTAYVLCPDRHDVCEQPRR